MVKVGREYVPTAAKIVMNGKYTQFTIPQHHKIGDRIWNDGYLNVLVEGDYIMHEGDSITIKEITAANIRMYKNKQYFSVYAKVDYKTYAQNQAKENLQTLEDDIPEDLF